MRLTAEHYKDAAGERIEDAQTLHNARSFTHGHFTAGLAVECVFRAYAVRNGAPFDGRHDLKKWFELSRFDKLIADKRHQTISAAYGIVLMQWNSTQRKIWEILRPALTDELRLSTGFLLTITPEEYNAMVDRAA